MQKLGFCFKCGNCSCIVCEGNELEPKRDKITLQNSPQIKNIWTKTCFKINNMDIHSNNSFVTSSSSRKSTPNIMDSPPTLEDIQVAYKKLQSLRAESSLMNFCKPPIIGLKHSSNVSKNKGNQSQMAPNNTSTSGSNEHPYLEQGRCFTPNKIANYRGPLSTRSNTPTLSNSPDISIQEFNKKSNMKKSLSIQKECLIDDQSTERLMNKLRNLDEILQNLDQSLLRTKISTNLSAPLLEDNLVASNFRLSNKLDSTSKVDHEYEETKNYTKILPAYAQLAFDTNPCSITTKCNSRLSQMSDAVTLSIMNSKSPKNLEKKTDLNIDNNWTESGSSEATNVPQSFSTPIANKATNDIPLLLSKFACFSNQTPTTFVEENTTIIKELVELVEKQLLKRMQFLQRTRRQVNMRTPFHYIIRSQFFFKNHITYSSIKIMNLYNANFA